MAALKVDQKARSNAQGQPIGRTVIMKQGGHYPPREYVSPYAQTVIAAPPSMSSMSNGGSRPHTGYQQQQQPQQHHYGSNHFPHSPLCSPRGVSAPTSRHSPPRMFSASSNPPTQYPLNGSRNTDKHQPLLTAKPPSPPRPRTSVSQRPSANSITHPTPGSPTSRPATSPLARPPMSAMSERPACASPKERRELGMAAVAHAVPLSQRTWSTVGVYERLSSLEEAMGRVAPGSIISSAQERSSQDNGDMGKVSERMKK